MNNNMNIQQGMGKLVIRRVKNIYGFAVKLPIYVNGIEYKVGNGEGFELDLVPGLYYITWKFWCRRDQSIQINVMPGNYYVVEFKPDYLWGGFKLSKNCKFN